MKEESVSKISGLIKTSRIGESLLMVAFFVVGLAYIPLTDLFEKVPLIILSLLTCYLLVQSIYLLNSYYGMHTDLLNARFDQRQMKNVSVVRGFLLGSFGMLLIAFLLAYFQNPVVAILILVNYLIWLGYGNPSINLKGHFLGGSAVHFASGIINFHIGYLLIGEPSVSILLLSVYFSLLFSAGHLHHMVLDYEADKAAGIKTLATVFGMNQSKNLSIFVFIIAGLYYSVLVFKGIALDVSVYPVAVTTVIHVILFFLYRSKLDEHATRVKYRSIYRALHGTNFLCLILLNLYDGAI